MRVFIAYTYTDEQIIQEWLDEVQTAFPKHKIVAQQLSLSISCHTGPGCLAIGCARIIK